MLEGHSEALLVVQDQYQQLAKENTQNCHIRVIHGTTFQFKDATVTEAYQ